MERHEIHEKYGLNIITMLGCQFVDFVQVKDKLDKLKEIEQIIDTYRTDNSREPMYDTEDYLQSIINVVDRESFEEQFNRLIDTEEFTKAILGF